MLPCPGLIVGCGKIGSYIGIMETKMETTIVYCGYRGLYRDNGEENGNYYSIWQL